MEGFKIKIEDKNSAEYLAPKIFACIEKILENPVDLGSGRAGKVFSTKGETFCVKEIIDDNLLYSSNSIHEEMEIQNRAIRNGVRSPKTIMSLETEIGRKFLIMEKIQGGSLKDIKEGRISVPEGFVPDSFWVKVKAQVKKLHDSGVHHRDLHPGNIMFEYVYAKNTEGKEVVVGVNPVIIDYGLSIVVHGDDEDPYLDTSISVTGKGTRYRTDDGALQATREEMITYLT